MSKSVNTGYQELAITGFNYKYIISNLDIDALKTLLCSKTFLNQLSLLFANPSDYINSLKYYPFNVQTSGFVTTGGSERLKLGVINTEITGGAVRSIQKQVRLTSFSIAKKYYNFLDYEPYTKVELYIPYFGFISLPVNEVIGNIVNIYLSVDFDTGIGTIYIDCNGKVIMTTSTKLGLDIPMGASNLNEVVKDNLANALKVTAGIVTMAVAPTGKMTGALLTAKGLSMAVTSGIDAVADSQVRYTRGTLSGGTDMLASPTSIYAIITRPNPIPITSDYAHVKGKPLGDIRMLSTLHGFTIVDQIHVRGIPDALNDELKEIESLLKEGVEL